MPTLHFSFRGEHYAVNEAGHINANGIGKFSPTWVFLGGSRHHWSRRVTVSLSEAFKEPAKLNGYLGWDRDHGTTRIWGGAWGGGLPRIRDAYVTIDL